MMVGASFFNDGSDHVNSGSLKGYIGFAGVMSGADASYEPVIRAFAKERFPVTLAQNP